MNVPISSFQGGKLSFGGRPLFQNISLTLSRGDKVCLVGRNGSGKSTLLKILSKVIEPDEGEYFLQPGTSIRYLAQDVILPEGISVLDFVSQGVSKLFEAESILDKLGVKPDRSTETLSGGERRRVALASALVADPNILLLDEPTNHLDLPTIEWLEVYLRDFKGAFITISHDRSFLATVSTSTLWLDRGNLYKHEKGFSDYDRWSEQILEEEERQSERLNTKLRLETEWLHRGVTARRKRNQGRLRKLQALRQERQARQSNQVGKIKVGSLESAGSSKMVIEVEKITKSFEGKTIIHPFDLRVLKGERIGIIGANGAGKTTLVKMLVKELSPDQGSVRLGSSVRVTYFDQLRSPLSPKDTLWETLCPQGRDQVYVQGHSRHVMGYLKDFLFTEKQVRGQVSILSGGEKNRLLLAKALASPGNLLILDEPTNDLDMDTLDLLVEWLSDYEGTLILVSHDRDFLDKLTTSIIAVEGDVREYVGGYEDYIRQRPSLSSPVNQREKRKIEREIPKKEKLTYPQRKEWEGLPSKIEQLEKEIIECEERISDPLFYQKDPEDFLRISHKLEVKKEEKDQAEHQWLELCEKIEKIS